MYISPYCRLVLVPPNFMKFGIRGQLTDIITCVKFLVDRFRGYWVLTPPKFFPLTCCVALYNGVALRHSGAVLEKTFWGLVPLNFPSPPVLPTPFPSLPPWPSKLSLPSPSPFPSPPSSFPLPPLSFFLILPSPSSPLFLPLPPFPLEVGPLNPARGSEERCKLPSGVWGGAPAEIEFSAF